MDLELPVLSDEEATTPSEPLSAATVLFAGDSGDGMQLTGSQFTLAAAHAHNDLATLPDFPAEIRAPAGTTYGVSAFQMRFGSGNVRTPGGSQVDLLIAMNPAAVDVHLNRVRRSGSVLINTDAFTERSFDLANLDADPREDGTLDGYDVIEVPLTTLTRDALSEFDLDKAAKDRCKNMFALGIALWRYSRPASPVISWLRDKFADKPTVRDANIRALKKGVHFGERTEQFSARYAVHEAELEPGTYRAIRGAEALALGLITASQKSGLPLFYGSYPITPASDILHELSKHKNFGVTTFQAEDEIAAAGSALGAAFGGNLGVCATSGPGVALKTETIGLGVMAELPMVIVNMQRGGPSTGLPTKPEQGDLMQALYGRNGEAPLPVIAAASPGDCFRSAYEACRIATKYMTPVILLADNYLSSGSEPWRIPDLDEDLPDFEVNFAEQRNGTNTDGDEVFLPYVREDETGARPWAKPGTPQLEHRIGGLEKDHRSGDVSYDPENHQLMTDLREQKIQNVQNDIPATEAYGAEAGELLIVGWGSTRGAIRQAVDEIRRRGHAVASVHLSTLWPLPADLGEVLGRFDHHLVPELNSGQLVRVLRDRYLLPFESLSKVEGQPLSADEIVEAVEERLETAP